MSLALIFTTVVLSLFALVNATTGMPSSSQRTITPNSEWGSLVLLYAPPRMNTLCTLQLRGALPKRSCCRHGEDLTMVPMAHLTMVPMAHVSDATVWPVAREQGS